MDEITLLNIAERVAKHDCTATGSGVEGALKRWSDQAARAAHALEKAEVFAQVFWVHTMTRDFRNSLDHQGTGYASSADTPTPLLESLAVSFRNLCSAAISSIVELRRETREQWIQSSMRHRTASKARTLQSRRHVQQILILEKRWNQVSLEL